MKIGTAKSLSSIGLIFGIVGVCIIFKYGPPQPEFSPGIAIVLEDNNVIDGKTVRDINASRKAEAEVYQIMSGRGLLLILIGFVCQLGAVWIPENYSLKGAWGALINRWKWFKKKKAHNAAQGEC